MFTIQCPHCGKDQRVQEHWAGQTARCSGCGGEIPIPDRPPSPPETHAPSTLPSGTAPPIDPGQAQPLESGPLATSALAVTSPILAVIGFILPLGGIVALVLGIIAMNKIDNPANRLKGREIALGGAIIGCVATFMMLIGILLPLLGASRKSALRMDPRVRGIHQGMIQYAKGNNDKYPGLGTNEATYTTTPSEFFTARRRYQILLDGNYFTPEYLISPVETNKIIASKNISPDNFSYALLRIAGGASGDDGRRVEWAKTLNGEAPVVYDRNTGKNALGNASSLHTKKDRGDWRGNVAYNDNHTLFETGHILNKETRFGTTVNGVGTDNLFLEADGTDNDDANADAVYEDAD